MEVAPQHSTNFPLNRPQVDWGDQLRGGGTGGWTLDCCNCNSYTVITLYNLSAGFTHKTNPQNIDLNCIRLAFQVFLEGNEKGAFTFALKPVVSDPIYDKSEFKI